MSRWGPQPQGPTALPWEFGEGETDDGDGAAEDEDFGFANIEEDLAKYGGDEAQILRGPIYNEII